MRPRCRGGSEFYPGAFCRGGAPLFAPRSKALGFPLCNGRERLGLRRGDSSSRQNQRTSSGITPNEAGKLRPGNVHSADDGDEALLPEIERQQEVGKEVAFRADAAFAKPEIYEALEDRE